MARKNEKRGIFRNVHGVRKDRQSGTSAYGSQTTQTTPGAGGTGKRPGTADTDKTDAQKKQNTPGGSY